MSVPAPLNRHESIIPTTKRVCMEVVDTYRGRRCEWVDVVTLSELRAAFDKFIDEAAKSSLNVYAKTYYETATSRTMYGYHTFGPQPSHFFMPGDDPI